MAIMIPNKPYDFTPASLEDVMFEALQKLPEDYYVFHSFQVAAVNVNSYGDRTVREGDFVIFNPHKGIVCLEAKAGHVRYVAGEWLYSSGDVMKHNGPFKQAKSFMYELKELIKVKRGEGFIERLKLFHAVWFPSLSDTELYQLTLPADAPRDIILTKSALLDPLPFIEHIFEYNLCTGKKMNLSDYEARTLVTKLLCPEFNIVPPPDAEKDLKKISFNRLLREQANILNFLVEQRSAVINGAAGTGKTMIAIAKAQKHAREGESVLFLCYNSRLKNYLAKEYEEDNIYFYTIDGLACKLCNTASPNYKKLSEKLDDMYLDGNFPFKHIVIDEGQDFGKEDLEEMSIIAQLRDLIIDREDESGTFYIFYDKLQMVQTKKLPEYITEADCKLTLYKNCRNTENIAKTSLKPISERKPKLVDGGMIGEPANVHFCKIGFIKSCLDNVLAVLKNDKFKDIVILTTKTIEKSSIRPYVQGEPGQEKYGKYPVATCRTFKGLEADAVVLIDVDTSTFIGDDAMLFYVGTSRARLRLEIITDMDDESCRYALMNGLEFTGKIKNAKKSLATALNAIGNIDISLNI